MDKIAEIIQCEVDAGRYIKLGDGRNSAGFTCKICDIFIIGAQNAAAHSNGSKHLQKVNLLDNRNKRAPSPSVNRGLSPCIPDIVADHNLSKGMYGKNNEFDAIDEAVKDKIVSKFQDNYICNICRIQLSGTVPLQQHMIGKPHLKKIKLFGDVSAETSAPNRPDEERCDIMGANSPFHSYDKELEEAGKQNIIRDLKTGSYECTVCDVKLNACGQAVAHLSGKMHLKKMATKWCSGYPRASSPSLSSQSDIATTDTTRNSNGMLAKLHLAVRASEISPLATTSNVNMASYDAEHNNDERSGLDNTYDCGDVIVISGPLRDHWAWQE